MPNQELTQITNKINEFQELVKKNIPTVRERKLEEREFKMWNMSGKWQCYKCGGEFVDGFFGGTKLYDYRSENFCPSCVSRFGESTLKAVVDLPLTRTLLTQTRNDWYNVLTTYQNEIRNGFDSIRRFINDKITSLNYELGSLQNLQSDKNRLEQERNNLITDRDNWKREYGKIEGDRNKWKRDFDNKNRENEVNKQQLDQERRNSQDEKIEWTRTDGQKNARVATLEEKSRNDDIKKTELTNRAENAERDRDLQVKEWKAKFEEIEKEVKRLTDLLNNLQIENNNKNTQIKQKDEEISFLKNQAELSQEELLKLKIRFEERNLEQFAAELKINLEQLNSLSEFHERLFTAHKEHNQDNVINQKANIAQIKQKLLDKEISITNIQEICEKCERITQLNWKLSQLNINQTQLIDTNHEKDWKNINSNFTPELIQAWIKRGFTYEQCQEWINISSPEKQNLTIKEPAYYAWLRDIKKVNAEWVLNEGDQQELNREYLKWYQEQEQQQYKAQQEQPTNN